MESSQSINNDEIQQYLRLLVLFCKYKIDECSTLAYI